MSFQGTGTLVQHVNARDTQAADLGNYYTAITPTPGTGVISGTSTSFTETAPYVTLYNSGTATIYLVSLVLQDTAASTGAAVRNWTHTVDQGNRFSSGGTACTVNNVNALSANKSLAVVNIGNITATAATGTRRVLGNNIFRTGVDIVQDIFEFQYGAPSPAPSSVIATQSHFIHGFAPVVVPPNCTYLLYVWAGTFSTGITNELKLNFIEK